VFEKENELGTSVSSNFRAILLEYWIFFKDPKVLWQDLQTQGLDLIIHGRFFVFFFFFFLDQTPLDRKRLGLKFIEGH